MKLDYTHTRLCVADFAACFKFYRDVLGFEAAFGTAEDVYAEFVTGRIMLAVFRRDLMAQAAGTTALPASAKGQDKVVLAFAVENVDATHDELRKKGVAFVAPPTDRPDWMIRTAHFRDPDGNLLEINESLKK